MTNFDEGDEEGMQTLSAGQIARVCHEANRAYQISTGEEPSKSWDDCSDEMKLSAIAGVQALIDNPLLNPIDLHARWCDFKLQHGWVYGPVKDEKKKTHPCLVEYHELPETQRKKDYLFNGVVKALLK